MAEKLGSATYSPEDNKLRFYPFARLSKEDYDRVRAMGFIWAPKQELFVAPMWTPNRADFLEEIAGEIEDEDKTLVERAEERAERFESYSEKRAGDADRAHKAVSSIADNIPFGQPILVGHHSEKHARRDAEKIENGMRRAVKMWETSKYWGQRAQGVLSHAKYKELPGVRARRIKAIEADKRGKERIIQEAQELISIWEGSKIEIKEENRAKLCQLFGRMRSCGVQLRGIDGTSWFGAYDILRPDDERYQNCPQKTVAELQEIALRLQRGVIASAERWIEHYNNRLAYEKALLAQDSPGFHFEVGGRVMHGGEYRLILRVNKKGGEVVSLSVAGGWGSVLVGAVTDYLPPAEGDTEKIKAATKVKPLCNYPGEGFQHMTKAEYEASVPKWSDFPKIGHIDATETIGAHRVRQTRPKDRQHWATIRVFLTDVKRVDPPPAGEKIKLAPFVQPVRGITPRTPEPNESGKFQALKETLNAGVQTVTAPELFPTPPELANRIIEEAEIQDGNTVLEPSAGTGAILSALFAETTTTPDQVKAVEINSSVCRQFRQRFPTTPIQEADFLSLNGELGDFDRVLMNPPFSAEIEHVQHAFEHLKQGGKLVAIMSEGPFFRSDKKAENFRQWFEEIGGTSEKLPRDTFKESGTTVSTRLVIIEK